MPELPEVETTRRGIEPHIRDAEIAEVVVRQPRLRWPVPEEISSVLPGLVVERVERRAKYLLLYTPAGVLIIHLGMSGSLRIVKTGESPAKHDHVDILFRGGQVLRYTDPRRFGAVLWQPESIVGHPLLKNLGPEPLSEDFDGERLFACSRQKKQPVKTFIMDNHVVVGVGNIYANEALFEAGVDPRKAAGRISRQRYLRLAEIIKRVLARAIEQGGATLKDFVGGDGKPGYFQQQLQVYGRGGEKCRGCQKILKEVKIGQRATVFCSQCQR
ncbi:MAG: bifunctional DNA-formamidopyrimidine glycosylase/DNA-(apurinic or apyrimidinic site) lyase [Motiliproteus sp.]|nr:bifunctional DNA-formamidopyrimidine glycosylase/DNA-(apurinic or apyrimidinic site) lyase [Motiliproteus sp.]MCW9053541.1 bifunctional DNA-formamidopyrimidine glycosylase/DNA-(apurinic or apyrimidinic site) lyase [Motiliproteus sp.]